MTFVVSRPNMKIDCVADDGIFARGIIRKARPDTVASRKVIK